MTCPTGFVSPVGIVHAVAVTWDREQTRMSNDRIPMSKEGYEKKKAQLDWLKNEEMPRIAEQIALARGFGDLSENAEFDAAVEAQGMLQARINDLQNMLGRAMIVEKSTLPTDRVVYGSKVRVLDLDSTKKKTSSWSVPAKKTTTRTRSCSAARSARGSSARRSANRSTSRSPWAAEAQDRRDRPITAPPGRTPAAKLQAVDHYVSEWYGRGRRPASLVRQCDVKRADRNHVRGWGPRSSLASLDLAGRSTLGHPVGDSAKACAMLVLSACSFPHREREPPGLRYLVLLERVGRAYSLTPNDFILLNEG